MTAPLPSETRLEASLAAAEASYRSLVENAPLGIALARKVREVLDATA